MYQTQQAPLAQRVQFLEAKGLTGPEIEEAMRQAANHSARSQPAAQPQNNFQSPYPAYGPAPYPGIYPSQQWDWRDYFVGHLTLLLGGGAYRSCIPCR